MEKNIFCRVGFIEMPQQYSKLIDIASELKSQDFILRGLQSELAVVECDFEDDIDEILDKICSDGQAFSARYYSSDVENLSEKDKENLDFRSERCVVFLIYKHQKETVIPKVALVFGCIDNKFLFLILPVIDIDSNNYLESNEFVEKLKAYEENIKAAAMKDDRIFKMFAELKIRKNLAT